MKYYYGARVTATGIQAYVFHWDQTGNKQIFDYKQDNFDSENKAIDAAVEYCEDHDLDDVEMD